MRRALAALTLLFAFLLCFAGTASAYVDVGSKNRVGGFGADHGFYTGGFDSLALDTHQENTILLYDPATDVWFYVRQNPWTMFDPYGLWETGSYWGDVGQVWVGYGRAIKGTAVGIGTMVAHPVQTAKGIGSAVASPIQTGKAIMADYEGKLQSNAGVGEIVGEVLIGVATGGSVKALDKASDVADIAKVASKVDDAAGVGGDSARTTQKINQARTIEVDGIEFKGQRDLGHLSDADLQDIRKTGSSPPNAKGEPMVQHHIGQNPAGPVVEMPRKYHNIHNKTQHPKGNHKGVGLTKQERKDFDSTRRKLNKQRANDEIEKRGASE